jgi:hypothetical protein
MEMTAKEYRYAHLLLLIEEAGGVDRFAAQVGLTPNYISQLKGRHSDIGDRTARNIERSLGLEKGHMDRPPAPGSAAELRALIASMPESAILEAISLSLPKLSAPGLRSLSAFLIAELSKPEDTK